MIEPRNGYIYQTRAFTRFCVVMLGGYPIKWGLLAVPQGHALDKRLNAPMFQHTKTGSWKFTQKQLTRQLKAYGAEKIDYKLAIEPFE